MKLTIEPAIDLQIDVIGLHDADDVQVLDEDAPAPEAMAAQRLTYKLMGPLEKIGMLHQLQKQLQGDNASKEGEHVAIAKSDSFDEVISGSLSALAPLTLPVACHEAAGIPSGAKYWCFAYPVEALEEALEQINLADEMWAFFLLIGGFVFFDGSLEVLSCNALTLVPSSFIMHFDGPHSPSPACLDALRKRGRMRDVTLDALESAGFAAFAWVNPSEAPGGQSLSRPEGDDSGSATYVHGAFVYEMLRAVRGTACARHASTPARVARSPRPPAVAQPRIPRASPSPTRHARRGPAPSHSPPLPRTPPRFPAPPPPALPRTPPRASPCTSLPPPFPRRPAGRGWAQPANFFALRPHTDAEIAEFLEARAEDEEEEVPEGLTYLQRVRRSWAVERRRNRKEAAQMRELANALSQKNASKGEVRNAAKSPPLPPSAPPPPFPPLPPASPPPPRLLPRPPPLLRPLPFPVRSGAAFPLCVCVSVVGWVVCAPQWSRL